MHPRFFAEGHKKQATDAAKPFFKCAYFKIRDEHLARTLQSGAVDTMKSCIKPFVESSLNNCGWTTGFYPAVICSKKAADACRVATHHVPPGAYAQAINDCSYHLEGPDSPDGADGSLPQCNVRGKMLLQQFMPLAVESEISSFLADWASWIALRAAGAVPDPGYDPFTSTTALDNLERVMHEFFTEQEKAEYLQDKEHPKGHGGTKETAVHQDQEHMAPLAQDPARLAVVAAFVIPIAAMALAMLLKSLKDGGENRLSSPLLSSEAQKFP